MVAIVSGNSLGLNLTSHQTLGMPLGAGAVHGRNGESAYVNVATGNLVIQRVEDVLSLRGVDGTALRTYNSQGLFNDDNGDNWSTGFVLQPLQLTGTLNTAGSTLTRTARDGSASAYVFDSVSGLYRTTQGAGAHDTITFIAADSQLEWRDGSSGLTQRYQSDGAFRLLATADATGYRVTYTYDAQGRIVSETADSGETRQYAYTTEGNLHRVLTYRGDGTPLSHLQFLYDGSNRLVKTVVDHTPQDYDVSDMNRYVTDYEYDGSSKRLAGITQSDGTRLAFTYVDVGGGTFKLASVQDALGQTTSFAYGAGHCTVTDALGLVTRYDFDAEGQLTSLTPPPVAGVAAARSFSYAANGDVLAVTEGTGRITTFAYDDRGNQVLQRDHAGNTVRKAYDARNQLIAETAYLQPDPDGGGTGQPAQPLTSRFVYEGGSRALLRFSITAEGAVTEHRYNALGDRVSTVVYAGATYPVGGLAEADVPAESALATWCAAQDLTRTRRSDMTYDARGHLRTRTAYSASDAAGAGAGIASVEQFVRDASGRLLQVVSPSQGVTQFTYDGLGRVLTQTNALGQVTVTQYDDAGRRTVVLNPDGLTTTQAYDAAGRLVSKSHSTAAGAGLGETRFFYDAGGRLRMTQDPTGVRHWTLYDEEGRKSAEVDGNGSLTEFAYDGNGRLTHSISYATAISTAPLTDAAGAPVLGVSPAALRPTSTTADVQTWNAYDGAGRLVRTARTVGTGTSAAVEAIAYDGASRIVRTTQYANLALASSLSPGSIPVPAATARDRIVRHFHDDAGALEGTLDAEGYLTTFTYDAAGREVQRVRHASATTQSLRAAGTLAQLKPPVNGGDISSFNYYDGKGQRIAEVDAEGYLTEWGYDVAGNLVSTLRHANRAATPVTVTSSLASLRPTPSVHDQVSTRTFDSLGRLTEEAGVDRVTTRYAYDSGGRLVSTVRAVNTDEARTLLVRYDVQGRLVGELSALGASLLVGGQTPAQVDAIWAQHGTRYTYDAAGRRTSTTDANGNVRWHYYDADGSLRYTINSLGEVKERRYDALGRLHKEIAYSAVSGVRGPGGLIASAIAVTANAATDSVTTYSYARDSTVASVLDAEGNQTSIQYNSFGEEILRTQYHLSSGVRSTQQYTVDRRGLRTATLSDPNQIAALETTEYDAFGRATRRIDANGKARVDEYDRLGRVVVSRDPMGGARSASYDAFGRQLTTTDALGNTSTFTYDPETRSVSMTTPEGVRTATSYTRHGQVHTLKDGRGGVTTYTYDRDGRLVGKSSPLATESSSYDAAGRLVETRDAAGNRVNYAYDATDRVLTRTVDSSGLALATRYTYDAKGQRVTVTDPNGNVTTYAYDRKGRVATETVDPGGLNLRTTYTYDAADRTLTVTSPAGTRTQYVYDSLGRRTSERVDPAGLNLERKWAYDDAGNAISSTDAFGNSTLYAYDGNGRLAFTVDPLGAIVQNFYDAEGRLVRVIRYATPVNVASLPTAPGVADIQSRVLPSAADVTEYQVHDRDGRRIATVDGTGAVVRFTYDANGNVVQRDAFANRIDLSAWTGVGIPLPLPDPSRDTRQTTVYDGVNRAVFSMDGLGAVVEYRYDPNGAVVERIAYARPVPLDTPATVAGMTAAVGAVANAGRDVRLRYSYDAAGRLVASVDGMGSVQKRVYDRNGNVLQEIHLSTAIGDTATPATAPRTADDRILSYSYDAANRRVLSVDPERAAVRTQYDADGRVSSRTALATKVEAAALATWSGTPPTIASTADDRTDRFAYDAAGRLIFEVDALRQVKKHVHDANGRLLETRRYENRLDPAVAVTVSTVSANVSESSLDRREMHAYDAAGRRSSTTDALGQVERWTYDAIGNRTSFINKQGATWTYSYDATGRLVRERSPEVTLASSSFDPVAKTVVEGATRQVAIETVLRYDGLGNLTQRTEAAGLAEERSTRYEYDAAGRQVRVIFPPVGVYDAANDNPLANDGLSPRRDVENRSLEARTYYDALGNAVANRDVGGGLSQKVYDRAGRVAYEVDAAGYVTGYSRDTFGAVTALTRYGSGTALAGRQLTSATQAVSRAEVEGVLNASSFNHATDRVLRSSYDRAGRLVDTWQPAAFMYDAGLATSESAASARTRRQYNAFGDMVQESRARDSAATVWYHTHRYFDVLGRERAIVDPLGHVTTRAYDKFGNLERVTEYATAATPGSWNLAMFVVPGGSSADRATSYAYDLLDRKTGETRIAVEYSTGPAATTVVGNLTTTYGYDALGNQVRTTNALGESTLTFHDVLGRVVAVATPFQASNATNTLVEFKRDAHGNVVVKLEHNTPVVMDAGYVPLPAAPTDRSTITRFDALGRELEVRDANDSTLFSSYDAAGRVAKTWRAVTDADGHTRTQFQLNVYDALGQLVETLTPASTTVVQGGMHANYTPFIDYGDHVQATPARMALQWSDLVDPQGGSVRIEVDYVVTTQVVKYIWGSEVLVPESRLAKASRDFTAAAAAGGGEVTWGEKADRIAGIRVLQFVDGQWRSKWEGTLANASGSGVNVLSQAEAGYVSTRQEFNAFGEMTRRGTQGALQEYYDYDAAGRVWRTNAGDGVDRVQLYDLRGNVSAEIRSSGAGGVNQDVRAYQSVDQAHADSYSRRTDIQYNALGHVASRTEAVRTETRGGVTVQRQFVAASVRSAVPVGDLQTASAWTGMNEVTLGWNSLAPLGSGELRVVIDYKTPVTRHGGVYDAEFGYTTPVSYSGGVAKSYAAGLFDGTTHATGLTLTWAETAGTPTTGGVGQVTRVRVEKKDISGNWATVIDQAPGYGRNEILLGAPEDPQTAVMLQVRALGATAWTGVPAATLVDFGNAYRYDASALVAGTYEYIVTTTPQGKPGDVTASGTVSVTQPLLSSIPVAINFAGFPQGKLYWVHQDFSTQQVMRYRPVGGTAWSTLPVNVFGYNSDVDGVDTAHLSSGSYQFELLWTLAGQSSATQHATGTFTIVPGTAAYTIPASGLPNITNVALGTILIPGTYTGGDEANSYYTPPTNVTALTWDACGATSARYYNGSSWVSVTIDRALAHTDPYTGGYYGTERMRLDHLGFGTWYLEVVRTGERIATARYDVSIYGRQLTVTTPPYTPATYVSATPTTYSVSVTTPSSSYALSTAEGRSIQGLTSSALGNRAFRPVVAQNTDRWGNVVAITDPRSSSWVTTYRFNANNQMVQQSLPSIAVIGVATTQVYYDALGRQVAIQDANGNVNGQVYDGAGNVIEERQADTGVVRHVYDALGMRIQTTDAESRVVKYEYDRAGNLLAVDKGQLPTYQSSGSNVVWAGLATIKDRWTYDQLGQKLTYTNGNGDRLTYTYDLRGNVVETRQALGQKTRAAFDAQGRKIAELDANGFVSRWSYDYFGRVTDHSDLGGARYTYTYDHARQLTTQKNTRGQNLQYGYDAAGQLVRLHDAALNQTTTYMYDAGGRHIRERVVQNGLTYQDNHLAYDALGRLRDVADARVHVSMDYDKVGNRTFVATTVGYQGVTGEVAPSTVARYFKYDTMNRQTVVDAINPAGDIGTDRGHVITYDRNGNRTSDTSWGKRVAATNGASAVLYYNDDSDGTGVPNNNLTFSKADGWTTEVYRYDAANRLQSIVRDGVMVNHRRYDGADRLLFSGPASLPTGYLSAARTDLKENEDDGLSQTYSRYDANGRLLYQRTVGSDGQDRAIVSWDPSQDIGGGVRAAGYDGVGNAKGYAVRDAKSGTVTTYNTTFKRFEGHQADEINASSTVTAPGKTTHGYDANGHLVSLRDSSMSANNRDFVNDSQGRALYVNQAGRVQRQLIVNGEVLALYGAGINEKEPRKTDGNPNFANLADFELGYAPINSKYPNASPGTYIIRAGDSLQSIAQSAYGDSALWYRIAEANGLVTSTDLKVGQTLSIPNRVGTVHNNSTTFEPYDPSKITGDVTPHLPMPKEGCGGIGQVLMVIVAVVTSIVAPGILGALIGSIFSQGVGLATGAIDKFSWKSVAMSAVSAGVSQALPANLFAETLGEVGGAMARAATSNLVTQGIGVATGLQKKFDWRGVAASGIGAGVGAWVGRELGLPAGGGKPYGMETGEFVAKTALKSMAAGLAAAAVRGGRIAVQQVAVDAFGNALGSSLAANSSSTGTFNEEGTVRRPYVDGNGDHIVFGPAGDQADAAPFIEAFGQDYDSQWVPGVQMADASGRVRLPAGWSLNNGRMVAPDGTDMGPTNGGGMVSINIRHGQAPAAAVGIPIGRQLVNIEAMADAYRISGIAGATGDPLDLMGFSPVTSNGGSFAADSGDRRYPHDGGGTVVGRSMMPEAVADDSFLGQMHDDMNESLGKLVGNAQEHYVQNGAQSSGWHYGLNAAGYIASEFFPRTVGQVAFDAVGGPVLGRIVGAGVAQLNKLPVLGSTLSQLGHNASAWSRRGVAPPSSTAPSAWGQLRAADTSSMNRAEKGLLGEARGSLAFQRAGYEKLPSRLASNNGFDGVFVKKGPDGTVVDIIISESKFTSTGRASLANTKMGKQMSPEWIDANIRKMMINDDPAVRATGRLLRNNSELIRTKANVLDPAGVNRWNVLNIPE